MRWGAVITAVALAACNADVRVDPEGYRCNELDPCPLGYACVAFVCRVADGAGGGEAGGV
ncbi:MAG: hypothetical protein INH37_26270, partial [Myxococcaceae bacterium]|nr:hypothetical protein [Myxococcaceae bacterium]